MQGRKRVEKDKQKRNNKNGDIITKRKKLGSDRRNKRTIKELNSKDS